MKILKFTLKGRTAFFKKPDVNSYYYFTYGNIHKVALLGLFGAIRGYQGYNQMKKINSTLKGKERLEVPEFYEKLESLKAAILPNFNQASKGTFSKKIQYFNNSVGYASEEQGGNLIIKEQWLENPSWMIYVLINSKEAEYLAEDMLNYRCVYPPYLGKNDHLADILDVKLYDGLEPIENVTKIDSLCPRKNLSLSFDENEEDEDGNDEIYISTFKYEEQLPIGLNRETNMYQMEPLVCSNLHVRSYEEDVYQIEGKNIVFF